MNDEHEHAWTPWHYESAELRYYRVCSECLKTQSVRLKLSKGDAVP